MIATHHYFKLIRDITVEENAMLLHVLGILSDGVTMELTDIIARTLCSVGAINYDMSYSYRLSEINEIELYRGWKGTYVYLNVNAEAIEKFKKIWQENVNVPNT